jgi:glycosyltransferase involved in cell wall biosynthesis
MDAMSRSDFFISPPGWRMPHSHNLIEAMSVGTIPITNYHSYMRPPLTPGGDCLAFSTLEELENVIDRALNMEAKEVQRLRKGVISYYDENLEPERFGKKLMERPASILEVVVNDESGR